jgi:Phage phiEco32-like COOH.NH2 ligase-type 2
MFSGKILALGADPEAFFLDKNGKPVSAEGLLGGSKHVPKPMEGLPQGFYIQEDNVSAEFNIPPATTVTQFDANIFKGLRYVKREARKHGLVVGLVDALHFSPEQLATRQAQTLGCEPDYNAWTDAYNPKPKPPESLRTAAGHVHISFDRVNYENQISIAKMFDIAVTIPSLLVTKPSERRSLYGKAGAVRLKDYGVECRALSNFWLDSSAYRKHIFNTVIDLPKLFARDSLLWDEIDSDADIIQNTINTHNIDDAINLMGKYQVGAFPNE